MNFGKNCPPTRVQKIILPYQGIALMGPLLVFDPEMTTPFRKWLAKTAQKCLPSLAVGGIDPSLITHDADQVAKPPYRVLGSMLKTIFGVKILAIFLKPSFKVTPSTVKYVIYKCVSVTGKISIYV
jgi:hypothetical protein